MLDKRGHIEPRSSTFKCFSVFILFALSISGSFGQDIWAWEVNVYNGSFSYKVVDGTGDEIFSPSSQKPEEIVITGGSIDPIPMGDASGGFDGFCWSGDINESNYGINWKVYVRAQPFSYPSEIPNESCEGEMLSISILNDGYEGHQYSFWVSLDNGPWKLVSESFMELANPQHDFQFDLSESKLLDFFGLTDPNQIYGSYRFIAEVTTCHPGSTIKSDLWVTDLYRKPPTDEIEYRGRECPEDDIRIRFNNLSSNFDEITNFTVASLLSAEESGCTNNLISDEYGNAYCILQVLYNEELKLAADAGTLVLPLNQGNYVLFIEGQMSCMSDPFIFEVTPLPILNVSSTAYAPSCLGNNDGYIEVEILEGTPPFIFNGNEVSSNFTIDALSAGSFNGVISDNCYELEITEEIEDGPVYSTIVTNQIHPTCNANGSLEVVTDYDGDQEVLFQITDGKTTWGPQEGGLFTNLPNGDFTASTNINGQCYFNTTTTLNAPPDKIIGVDQRGQLCSDSDGSMVLFINDLEDIGDSLYASYNLIGSSINGTVSGQNFRDSLRYVVPVPPGQYLLVIENDCKDQTIFEGEFGITPIEPVSIESISDQVISCSDGISGDIEFSVKNGTPDYSVSLGGHEVLNLGKGNYQISGLGQGYYSISAKDGCEISTSEDFSVVVANEATEISLDQFSVVEGISCPNSGDASIVLTVSGGFPFSGGDKDYQVRISDGDNEYLPILTEGARSEFLYDNLGPGTYYPFVLDNNECNKSFDDDLITIDDPPLLFISTIDPSHFGSDQVKFDPGDNLIIKCHGDLVDFSPEYGGGTGGYSFVLEGGTLDEPLTSTRPYEDLDPASYTFTVTDENGCQTSILFTLNEPEPLVGSGSARVYSNLKNISCVGVKDGEVTINITGGMPPYDFAIDAPGKITVLDRYEDSWTFSGLEASHPFASYSIVVTDYLGCQFESEIILEPPLKPSLDYVIQSDIIGEYEIPCKGESASIKFHATGGDGINPYKLIMDDVVKGLFNISDSSYVLDVNSGIYEVKIMDERGCESEILQLDLTEPNESLSLSVESTPPNCIGGDDGVISLDASGGILPYEFKLDDLPWQSDNVFSVLEAGDYQISVRDFNQCEVSTVVNVPLNPNPLTIELVEKASPSCHHGTDGSITVQTSNFILKTENRLAYYISGGHYRDDVIEIVAEVAPLSEVHSITFDDLWDTRDPDFVPTHYEIWVEDVYECEEMVHQYIGGTELALNAPDAIYLESDVTAPSCHNGNNGWFAITARGGVPPYEFSIDNSNFSYSNTADELGYIFNELPAGDYSIYVRDANFKPDQPTCLSTMNIYVPQGMDMNVIEEVKNVSCAGGDNGAINVEVETFYENNSFAYEAGRLSLDWFFGDTPISEGLALEGLSKGNYTLKLSYDQDTVVCREQVDIAVNGPKTSLSIDKIKTYPSSCGEDEKGRAIVSFVGGWADSTTYYNLNDAGWLPIFGSSVVLNELSIGSQNIKIAQSAFDCQDESAFSIKESFIQIDTVFIQAPTCSNGQNGTIILGASNAIQPGFLIADSSYSSSSGIYSDLQSGKTYNLVVIDEANPLCVSDTISFSFSACEDDTGDVKITGVPVIQSVTCELAADGIAQVIVSGGLPPYQYLIDGTEVPSENLSGLSHGLHQVIVVDDLNKKDTAEVNIEGGPDLVISSISTTRSTCDGRCDGSAIVIVEGGSGSSQIRWADGFIGTERDEMCPGLYEFQVVDVRNETCQLNGQLNITAYEDLTVLTSQITNPTCPGNSNGKIVIKGSGGSGNYSFEWGGGSTGAVLEGISAGDYEVTLKDNLLNCSVTEKILLSDHPSIFISETITMLPSCEGSADGSIELVIENAISPLVEWDDGQHGPIRRNLRSGSHSFRITASNSCQLSGIIDLPEREHLTVGVSKTDNNCYGICEGIIDLTVAGGVAPYYVEWESGVRTLQRTNLCSGIYDYQVIDRLGCILEGSVEIRSPDPLEIELLEKNDVSCNGLTDGTLEIGVSGGAGSYSYLWSTGIETQSIEDLSAGNYTINISDENGCSTNATYSINQPQSIFLKYEHAVNPSCDGKNDGLIEVLASGGNSSYQYTWDDFTADPLFDGLYEGNYQLTVEDIKGCAYSKTFTLEAPPPLSLINVQYQNPICYNESSGLIQTEVAGGTLSYVFSWSTGQMTSTIDDLPNGDYELTVTDENGCKIASSFHLSNPDPLSIEGIDESMILCEGGSVFISPDGDWETYFWEGPSDFSSTSDLIEASTPGDYSLSVENEDGCVVSKSFSIERLESILQADFIRISEAVVNEPLIFVDLSLPVPDQVEWIVPESDNIIVTSMDDQLIELVFTKPGAYELGLVAYYKNCFAELFKTIEIEAGSPDLSNARVDSKNEFSTSVYPNPSRGNLEVIVNSDTREMITVRLLNTTRDELAMEYLSGKLDYLIRWDLSDIPSGVYFLVLQSGDTFHQKRILLVR